MLWLPSHRFDRVGAELADRHYSRRTVGSPQFVPPGSCVVLRSRCGRAIWASLRQKHQDHRWAPSWVCSIFRNEGAGLSSELIRDALAATRGVWGDPPVRWGMVTFVKPSAVRSSNPGWCFIRAGFEPVGWTKGGHGREPLRVLSCPPERWPEPMRADGQLSLLGPTC